MSLCKWFLAVAVVFSINFSASAEGWRPIGRPNFTNLLIRTVGDITYFQFTSVDEGYCLRVSAGPVTRSGTNLSQTINLERWAGLCGFPSRNVSEGTSVLGTLDQGNYTFIIESYNDMEPFPNYLVALFSIATNTPTVLAAISTNQFQLTVDGVSGVTYTIEASTTLTNWSSIRTNIGAPFNFAPPADPSNHQFFRVRADSAGVTSRPAN